MSDHTCATCAKQIDDDCTEPRSCLVIGYHPGAPDLWEEKFDTVSIEQFQLAKQGCVDAQKRIEELESQLVAVTAQRVRMLVHLRTIEKFGGRTLNGVQCAGAARAARMEIEAERVSPNNASVRSGAAAPYPARSVGLPNGGDK